MYRSTQVVPWLFAASTAGALLAGVSFQGCRPSRDSDEARPGTEKAAVESEALEADAAGAPAAGSEAAIGLTTRMEGDTLVVVPQDPTQSYLVVGMAADGGTQTEAVTSSELDYQQGELRLTTDGVERFVVMELDAVAELELEPPRGDPASRLWSLNPCKPETCDPPMPPCPPNCAPWVRILQGQVSRPREVPVPP